jgi:hypothetical protein
VVFGIVGLPLLFVASGGWLHTAPRRRASTPRRTSGESGSAAVLLRRMIVGVPLLTVGVVKIFAG